MAKPSSFSLNNVVHDWRHRYPDFPDPVAQLRQALVWSWQDVARWARRTGRLQ